MTASPFGRDLTERAGKSLGGGITSFMFTDWVEHLVALTTLEKAAVFAFGAAVSSVVSSLLSRRFGQRGTASALKEVEYR